MIPNDGTNPSTFFINQQVKISTSPSFRCIIKIEITKKQKKNIFRKKIMITDF